MSSDKIELYVNKMRIEHFVRYTIDADIYNAADAFSLELAYPEVPIKAGMQCELYVNGERELSGLIDQVDKDSDKFQKVLKLSGRDLMGLLVDSCCTEFFTAEGWKLKALAEKLLKNVPFISRKDIVYEDNIRGNLKKKKKSEGNMSIFDLGMQFKQIEPGQTIFEVLKTYSRSRGLLFYARPDGTFVLGKPKDGGDPEFSLIRRKDGRGNNVIRGRITDNYSKRFSRIIVAGQQQGLDIFGQGGAPMINTKAFVTDPDFPFYKPFVATDNNDERSPKLHAQMLLEHMKFEGFRAEYQVPGHSQGKRNWTINAMCQIEDEDWDFSGSYLIYGRQFTMSKDEGSITTLRLGLPGMVQ